MEPPNQSYLDGMSGVGQLLLENERTKQKLRKVQQRRDFYAKQYFQTLQQLDHVRAELARAMNTIKELRGRDQSTRVVNPPNTHPSAHSNTTTPDSGTSLSPGIDVMDGRGQDGHVQQVDGRDQREGPPSLFWSYDSSRPMHSYRPTQANHVTVPDKPRPQPSRHLDHQSSQPHSEHLHRHAFLHHQASPMHHQTPPLHQRKLTLPASVSVKDDSYPPHPSAFSPTKPHFPVSPLQRRPPPIPSSASTISGHTLPQHHLSPGGKPAFQRSATLPHFFPPQMLKMYSSGTSDEDDEDRSGSRDGGQDSDTPASRVSAFTAMVKNSSPSVVSDHLATRSATSLMPSSSVEDPPEMPAPQPSSQLHRGVSRDHAHCVYDQLSNSQLMTVCSDVGDPNCSIQKLEIKNSRLGEVQLMNLFCTNLTPNHSITELSLPDNGIGKDALSILLDTVQTKPGLKELKLRGNRIGQDCAPLIKSFLAHTTLDSLVMTGNEIEQFSHLMDGQLPKEFSMEYSTDGSEDSGVLTTPSTSSNSELSPQPHHQVTKSFKYLRL